MISGLGSHFSYDLLHAFGNNKKVHWNFNTRFLHNFAPVTGPKFDMLSAKLVISDILLSVKSKLMDTGHFHTFVWEWLLIKGQMITAFCIQTIKQTNKNKNICVRLTRIVHKRQYNNKFLCANPAKRNNYSLYLSFYRELCPQDCHHVERS